MLKEETSTWFLHKEDLPTDDNNKKQDESSSSSSLENNRWLTIENDENTKTNSSNNTNNKSIIPQQLQDHPHARALFVQLSPDALKLGELYNFAVAPCCGAVSSFVGTTRDVFEGKLVEKLEYEVYGKMAVNTIAKIAFVMFDRWKDIRRIVISHRSGEVGICHPSVVIHVSSVHRRQGLEACQYAIDTLKADVPIWKREFYRREREDQDEETDLTSKWKANSECCHGKRKNKDNNGEVEEEAGKKIAATNNSNNDDKN